MQKRQQFIGLATAVVAWLGVASGVYLLEAYVDVHTVGSAQSALCNISAFLNCSPVARSAWAQLWNIPMAAFGLGFYFATAVLTVWGLWRPRDVQGSTRVGAALVWLFFFALLWSIFLAGYSILQVQALCVGCVVLYGVSAVGFLLTWLWNGAGPWRMARALPQLGRIWLTRGVLPVWLVLFVGAVALSHAVAGHLMQQRAQAASAPQAAPVVVSGEVLHAAAAPSLGPSEAPVTLVLFSDFECEFCAVFSRTLHQVRARYGDQLRIEFRHLPLPFHPNAARAAAVAICADRLGQFWRVHDAFYANQKRLKPETLPGLLSELGFNPEALLTCAAAAEVVDTLRADAEAARRAGVRGTPTFFINGVRYIGAQPRENVQSYIDAALAVVPSNSR